LDNEISPAQSFIRGRGKNFCRGCLSGNLFSGLDLGQLPIANELQENSEISVDKYPLHLMICSDCYLAQVEDITTPERIFRDYRYLSSMSTTFLQHAEEFVKKTLQEKTISKGEWVLEIASNDGYLLKNFVSYGIKVLGVEPALNVAVISRDLGIETISEFFSGHLAQRILSEHGYPKLIIANNVMAHVPDIRDFVKGLSILCGPNTTISIENPSLANILIGMQFDTIYHEHFSYLSASVVKKIGEMSGLHLFKIESLPIHGGSNRYFLQQSSGKGRSDGSVEKVLEHEQQIGLFNPFVWSKYSSKVEGILGEYRRWANEGSKSGKRIFGYGAAAKASTFLNLVGNQHSFITAIADTSTEKQGRYFASLGIQIINPQDLFAANPTDIIIFPWNIKVEIANYLRKNLKAEVKLWTLIPDMRLVNTQ